jgi:hypothetical protein
MQICKKIVPFFSHEPITEKDVKRGVAKIVFVIVENGMVFQKTGTGRSPYLPRPVWVEKSVTQPFFRSTFRRRSGTWPRNFERISFPSASGETTAFEMRDPGCTDTPPHSPCPV